MKNLTRIDFSENQLNKVPEELADMKELKNLDLSKNPLSKDAFKIIVKITHSDKLRAIRLTKTQMDPESALKIIQVLPIKFAHADYSLETFGIDDMKLPSFEGLGLIPIDILQQGARKIVRFMLDLFRSPEADPLYRSKLMVVGFESVGKTSILDCLFPKEGWMKKQGKLKKTQYWFRLEGSYLGMYHHPEDREPHKGFREPITNRQWEVKEVGERGLKLTPRTKEKEKLGALELSCETEEERDGWLTRLKRLCMNEATHGIEIQRHQVAHPAAEGRLELSVWDFAGQHDYYQNHQHFLSTRSVFLVLWKLSDGEEGLRSLDFWLRSLAIHLAPPDQGGQVAKEGRYHSIIVVGTFLDHPSVAREGAQQRGQQVLALARECGLLGAPDPLTYLEVSCQTLEGIPAVYAAIVREALSHSYMGEKVPKSYLHVEKTIKEMARGRLELPVVGLPAVLAYCRREVSFELGTIRRALSLLSLWGECIYYDSPPELASLVILDPKFLAKGILADLFSHDPNIQAKRRLGLVHHRDLVHIWARFGKALSLGEFTSLASSFIALLDRFGVCFVVDEDRDRPFEDQRSIIPALLPEQPEDFADGRPNPALDAFRRAWPKDPPFDRPVEIERIFKFTVIPPEMVSRLLVRLHPFILNQLVWKNDVVILMKQENIQSWIRAEVELNRFVVTVRGSNPGHCAQLIAWVVNEVMAVSQRYRSVRWQEAVRSPHSMASEIDLREILEDLKRPLEDRRLICPMTGLPVRAEMLQLRAGLILQPPQPSPSWWMSKSPKMGMLQPVNGELLNRLNLFLKLLGADGGQVTKAFAINNPRLAHSFEIDRDSITSKHSDTGGLFRREDWRKANDANLRKRYLEMFAERVLPFRADMNDGTKTFATVMIQGTSENAAYRIIKNGFGTVATTDDGFYGRGIYFTSSMQYASTYASETELGKVFLINLVLPGNPYPVTEHPTASPNSFLGKACRPGYQSHYVVVGTKSSAASFPAKEGFLKEEVADELVIFEGSQALPLFLVYSKQKFNEGSTDHLQKALRKEWANVEPTHSTEDLLPSEGLNFLLLNSSESELFQPEPSSELDQLKRDNEELKKENKGLRHLLDSERREKEGLNAQISALKRELQRYQGPK